MAKKRRKRIVCPNCEKQLKEHMNYCFNCGQENHIKRVSVKMLVSDFSTTYFSFDSKLFASLRYLLTKPSFLSTAYLNGKIEKYLRPIRMYVFISFVFFLLNSLLSTNTSYESIDFAIDDKQTEAIQTDGDDALIENDLIELDNDYFGGKFKKIFSNEKEIQLFGVFVKSKLPLLFFLLIPVFGSLLFFGFYKKSYYYVDHIVFALHLQSFVFVLLLINLLIETIFQISFYGVVFVLFLIYGFIAARRFYGLGKISTLFRLIFVGATHLFLSVMLFLFFFVSLLKYYNI